jgi:ligand-binding sensor domain-containing protein
MLNRTLYLLVILAFSTLLHKNAFCQTPYFKDIQIDKEDNTVSPSILIQDYEGLIWVGTNHGVYKFDGFNFEKVGGPQLYNKHVTSLYQSKDNKIWIGTNDGILYSFYNDNLDSNKIKFQGAIKSIVENNLGELWIATYSDGIYILKNGFFKKIKELQDAAFYSLIKHPNGNIYAASDIGLFEINFSNNTNQVTLYNSNQGLDDNIVISIALHHDNNLWLGLQEKGVCTFDTKEKRFNKLKYADNWSSGAVLALCLLENEFWIGTDKNGIVDYEFNEPYRIRFFERGNSHKNLKIRSILNDTENNIWIASDKGLFYSNGEKIESINEIKDFNLDSITAITTSLDYKIWVANKNGILKFSYDNENKVEQFRLPAQYAKSRIASLFEDPNGYIWIGTFNDGLFRLDPDTKKMIRFSVKNGLTNNSIISIKSAKNKIWLATLGGIFSCNIPENPIEELYGKYHFESYVSPENNVNIFLYTAFVDRSGNIWFGTDGNGISMYDGKSFKNYIDYDNGKGRIVYSITQGSSGAIWFSTLNNGIYKYDGKSFKNYGLKQGIRDLNITGISSNNKNGIVVIHSKGIDVIDEKTNEIFPVSSQEIINTQNCDLNIICKDDRGIIWFANQQQLIRLNITLDPLSQKIPVKINKIYTFMKPGVNLLDSIFEYNQNQISFDYIGLYFEDPDAITYSYRLLGNSNQWIKTRDRIVTFAGLYPGKYTFQIKASKNDNFSSSKITSYNFEIKNPIWKRQWFIFLCFILLATGLTLYLKEREKSIRRIEGLKKEKIEYQFETLKSQVNPHFLFNSFNTLISIIEEDKEKAVNYVEHLSDYFRNMIQYRDKDTITVSEELDMVKSYYYLQKKRFGNSLNLNYTISKEKLKYLLPPLTLQLLIENAIKHNAVSKESTLEINIEETDHNTLIITNNLNIKIRPEPSTGIGLNNIVNRIKILTNQDVKIKKTSTQFIVELPIIKA